MNANNSMPAKMTLVEMVTDLINLIKKEELLRRHHRAYLHVRDDIHECCDALTAYINSTLIPTSEGDLQRAKAWNQKYRNRKVKLFTFREYP